MNREDMLAQADRAGGGRGRDLVTLRAIVEEASELGATRVLARLGLERPQRAGDIDELRELLRRGATPRRARGRRRSAGSCAACWRCC